MKFPTTKYGLLKADPRGAHVVLVIDGRALLGTVTGAAYDPAIGSFRFSVRHFNGEPWPLEPPVSAVDVLERES